MRNRKLIIFVGFLILLIGVLGLFDAINNKIYENYIFFNKKSDTSPDIVLIEIDNKSIKALGRWPWKRSTYSKLLKKIKGYPKAIGIMLSFSETFNESDDEKLLKTLKSIDSITLIPEYKFVELNNISIAVPIVNFLKDIKQGHSLLNYSKSGVVKSIPPFKTLPAFSLSIVKDYYNNTSKIIPEGLKGYFDNIDKNSYNYSTKEEILIDYKRTPDKYKRFSFIDVLRNKVNPKEFKNKIVLIGVTDKYKTGGHVTPFTGEKNKIKSSTDVELQAQIIDSFINYRQLQEIPYGISVLLSILLALGFYVLINNKSVLYQGISVSLVTIIICIADFILFKQFAIWFPPALLIILVLLIFSMSEYLTTTKTDYLLMETINNIKNSNSVPLKEIPSNIDSKAAVLSSLLEIINNDRQAIKKIIDSINSGIIVIDDKGKIIWVNEKFYKLLNQSHILHSQIEELVKGLNIEIIEKELSDNNEFKTYFKINYLDIACIVSTIPNSNQYIAVFNDITELRQASQFKNEMVKIVSHEMRSPLTSIILCAENIFSMKESDASIDHAKRIINTSQSLLDTINNFLSINKLEHNLLQLNKEKVDIANILNKSIEIQTPLANNKNITFIVNNEVTDPVNMDYRLILMALNVLISNAIKYSNNSSEITITVKIDNDLIISVKDSGPGIPEQEKELIFDKFYRASNIRKDNLDGIGLGLAIAKKIIELHHGKIELESELNKGSTFAIIIPIEE